MEDRYRVFIVEDKGGHWRRLQEYLSTEYIVYPNSNEEHQELMANIDVLISFYKGDIDLDSPVSEAKQEVVTLIEQFKPDLLILDAALSGDDLITGQKFLKDVRVRFHYTPILILSGHTFEDLETNNFFSENPNYYLEKQGTEVTKEMVEKRLKPVINLLLRLNKMKNMEDFVNRGFHMIDRRLETIEQNVSPIRENIDILLRIAQYEIGKSDKKAKELVDQIISSADIELQEIIVDKESFLKSLNGLKRNLISAFKEDTKDEIVEITKSFLKEWSGETEDKSLVELTLKLMGKGLLSAFKFYRTGDT